MRIYKPIKFKGGGFLVAISDVEKELIIGMDVLKPVGISIDIKTGELSIKNEIWEAFKTISGIGVAFFLGVKILKKLFEKEKKMATSPNSRHTTILRPVQMLDFASHIACPRNVL